MLLEHVARIFGLPHRGVLVIINLMAASWLILTHIRVIALSLDSNILVYLHRRCALVDNLPLDRFKIVKMLPLKATSSQVDFSLWPLLCLSLWPGGAVNMRL